MRAAGDISAGMGEPAAMATREICADTLMRLRGLELYVQLLTDMEASVSSALPWIEPHDLLQPESVPLADLLGRFAAQGFAVSRRAFAASLLLRFGWASGFAVASYLACERVPVLDDYALQFSARTLLHELWIREARFHGYRADPLAGAADWAGVVSGEKGVVTAPSDTRGPVTLRRRLLESLLAFSEPVVEVYHRWSGFSRHALWSMVVSSWGAQFTNVARQLGDTGRGIAEARALFAQYPEIARAAPQLYEVRVGDVTCTCQRRAACCLYFKSPGRAFCASCPVLPEAERLERNRHWVRAQRTVACA
jgi:hypothetical protein